jgi:uncharacterized membrane protein (DUF485 family)
VAEQVVEHRSEEVEHRSEADWHAIERSPEFRELTKQKRAFVVPATIFFMVWYFGFIALCGYAPDFMGREFITDGLTVGYFLAVMQFVTTWILAVMYVRRANRIFDPLAARVRDAAGAGVPASSGRFTRDGAAEESVPARSATSEEVPQR